MLSLGEVIPAANFAALSILRFFFRRSHITELQTSPISAAAPTSGSRL